MPPDPFSPEFYTYDKLNRLTAADRGDLTGTPYSGVTNRAFKQEWGLDALGNWADFQEDANGDNDYTDAGDLDQDRTHNLVNELTGISEQADPAQTAWIDPAYEGGGNMTTIPKPADPTTALTAAYDPWNRLVEVTDGETVIATYEYDGLNRRIKKHIDTDAPDDPDGVDT